jgi:Cys-tRNA(Pro)/Cys-tRNA(Cys) deacylase
MRLGHDGTLTVGSKAAPNGASNAPSKRPIKPHELLIKTGAQSPPRLAGSATMSGGTPATVALDRAKIQYTLHTYDHDARAESYGDEAAIALEVDRRRIFKTLIASVDTRLVCAVVPVASRLSLKALAGATHGKKAELADPTKAQRATGYVVGGISPLGQKTLLPVVLDASVRQFDTIYVSAGKRGLQVELSPADLATLTAAVVAAIATV